MKKFNLLLTGLGGQGVLSIAEIILNACALEGINCSFYPTKGMAQRGGAVKAQLKLGQERCGPELALCSADAAVSMEVSESLKTLGYLKPGGDLLIFAERQIPYSAMFTGEYPSDEAVISSAKDAGIIPHWLPAESLPDNSAANIFVLGAAYKNTGLKELLPMETLLKAAATRFPKAVDANRAAFERGYSFIFPEK